MVGLTKYRIEFDGFSYWLKYKETTTILWIFKFSGWVNVWKPYYDKIHGRNDCMGWDTLVNSYDKRNLLKFVEKYPDISVYFKIAEKEQEILVQKAKEWNDNLEKSKHIINL